MTDLPTDNELSTLAQLGEDLYQAESEVLRLEAELKRAKRIRDAIQNEEIPEVMQDIGVLEFRTARSKFELREVLRVQPKADNRPLVLQAVEEAGDGALIKTTVTVPFNRGEDEKVKELLNELQQRGLQSKSDKRIEPSTLRKYVRDKLEAGEPIDQDLFGVRVFKQAIFGDGAPEAPIFDDE